METWFQTWMAFSLFGSAFAFFGLVVAIVLLLAVADKHNSLATAFGILIAFVICCYYWSNFPIFSYLTVENILYYLSIGFIFSLVRTYFKGQELKKKPDEKKYFILKDHVFRWWFF